MDKRGHFGNFSCYKYLKYMQNARYTRHLANAFAKSVENKVEMKIENFRPVYTASALKTLEIELQALKTLKGVLQTQRFGHSLDMAIDAMVQTKGRVIVSGMGKSGHIGRKIAATLRSTGTSSVFLHPGEASHGDLGVITQGDVVLAITWSGETAELRDIFDYCHRLGSKLIVATAHPDSSAARAADICLELPQVREACPNDLAPTSSTTLQLVLGDVLAVALIEARGFTFGLPGVPPWRPAGCAAFHGRARHGHRQRDPQGHPARHAVGRHAGNEPQALWRDGGRRRCRAADRRLHRWRSAPLHRGA
jgi:D-arabinose 5-phosphate isomerase GutQ